MTKSTLLMGSSSIASDAPCRRSFTSLARADGARKDLIDGVTHGPSGSIVDAYTALPWDSLCAEVAKLKIELRGGGVVIPMFRAVGSGACDSPCDSRSADKKKTPNLIDLEAISTARRGGIG